MAGEASRGDVCVNRPFDDAEHEGILHLDYERMVAAWLVGAPVAVAA